MKIWKLWSDANNYNNLTMCDENDWDRFIEIQFDGRKLKKNWKHFKVEYIENRKEGDTCSFSGGLPVFSRKAVEALNDFLKDTSEILPLLHDKHEYYIINNNNVKDCIDYNKSEVKRFRNSEKIMRFIKYSFIYETIKNEDIFKIKGYSHSRVFVSDKFKHCVEENGLKGFRFEKVWDLEEN